ncbi:MAG: AAA family ATPase [Eubacteriales bacterium]
MGIVYIFRGKAATGKTTISNMLAKKLSIPVFRKDDIVDALKSSINIHKDSINNEVCYNILYRIIQTNLDLNTNFILDIALGDRNNAKTFFEKFDFKDNIIVKFFIDCSDVNEWKRRHTERLKNPLPHQSFKSFEHVVEHYKNADINPFTDEYIIDCTDTLEKNFEKITDIMNEIGVPRVFI